MCKYCDSVEKLPFNFKELSAGITDGHFLNIDYYCGDDYYAFFDEKIKINYCPMCGKEL